MRALLFGTKPESVPTPETDNRNLKMLAASPMGLVEMDDPGFLRPDWVVTRPRLTGICGSESKQVFFDYASFTDPDRAGKGFADNPMKNFVSFPHVMGHEVVADVVALGPEAEGLEVGDRVALNPWLTCGPRGVEPHCPACVAGDLSQCWSFGVGPLAPGIHTGMCKDVPGGFGELMPAHDSMLFKIPDAVARRDRGVRRPVRGVAARHHAAPARARLEGARVRRRRARHVGARDPARVLPRRRGDGGGAVPDAAGARDVARRDRSWSPSRATR